MPSAVVRRPTRFGILPAYQGVSVHDGWKPYRTYTDCRHALCNIHHLRELTFLEEGVSAGLGQGTQGASPGDEGGGRASAHGARPLPRRRASRLARPLRPGARGGAGGQSPAGAQARPAGTRQAIPRTALVERLLIGQDEVLAFLDDFAVPFDNNQAEQDLRMLKVQQKIAGSFRADSGSEAFARIRGYCASLRKQGVALLAALETVFTAQPLYPAFD